MTFTTDVRSPLLGEVERMEAALQRVRAYIGSLSESGLRRGGPLRAAEIVTMVALEWQVSPDELKTRCNMRYYVEPRQVAAYLIRELSPASLQLIGRSLGGFNYTTMRDGIKAIKRRMANDPVLLERVDAVRRALQ